MDRDDTGEPTAPQAGWRGKVQHPGLGAEAAHIA